MERSLKLSWTGLLTISLTLVLSAIGCGDGQPGPTSSNPDPTVSAGTPGSSDTGGTPTAVPSPILTSAPASTAASPVLAPLPPTQTLPTLLKSFYGLVSVSKQVGPHVHELEWSLINRSRQQVTVLSAETQTASGELFAQVPQSYMDQYWSGGIVAPGGQVGSVAIFPNTPAADEVLTYQWVWKIRTLTQGTIVCTFTAPRGQICVPISSYVPMSPPPTATPVPTSTSTPAPVPLPGPTAIPVLEGFKGKIAYSLDREDTGLSLYTVNADGSGHTKLTDHMDQYHGIFFDWSPDGERLVFHYGGDDESVQIYVTNADGSNQVRITDLQKGAGLPVWSPNGESILFSGSENTIDAGIYIMKADGSDLDLVVEGDDDNFHATWSPDGTQLTFFSEYAELWWVINADGSGRSALYENQARELRSSWSPGWGRVAFEYVDDTEIPQIYVKNADGSNQIQLTDLSDGADSPSWSPDGQRIAFLSHGTSKPSLFVMNEDGSNPTELVSGMSLSYDDEWGRSSLYPALISWSPDGQYIVFAGLEEGSDDRSDNHIYVVNADGSGMVELPKPPGRIHNSPKWSPGPSASSPPAPVPTLTPTPAPVTEPDGTRIVFISERHGNYEIYAMNPDGSSQTRLTNNTVDDSSPSLSPDGTRIAFASKWDGNEDDDEIYVMNADGSGEATRLTNNDAWDDAPFWSADGKKIAFTSNQDGNGEIYVMNADGSNETRLTDNPAWDSYPSWSPDGKKITFHSKRDGNYEIYVMNADGSGEATRLTNNTAAENTNPSWSPDGDKIAFTSRVEIQRSSITGIAMDGNYEIFVMDADGSNQTRLTDDPARDADPSWSPDSTRIAFASSRDRNWNYEIYVMDADGSNQTRLTDSPARDSKPSWGPGG